MYGSVYGLVVITVERYVKVVYLVAHRNRYRRWMTYVGVAAPWLIGLVTSIVPSVTAARFDDGTCRTQVQYLSFSAAFVGPVVMLNTERLKLFAFFFY